MLLLKFGDQPCWNDPWYPLVTHCLLPEAFKARTREYGAAVRERDRRLQEEALEE